MWGGMVWLSLCVWGRILRSKFVRKHSYASQRSENAHTSHIHACVQESERTHTHTHPHAYMLACTSARMFVCTLACMLVAFTLLADLNSARRRCALLCFHDDTCPHVLPCLTRIVLACHRPCSLSVLLCFCPSLSVHPAKHACSQLRQDDN